MRRTRQLQIPRCIVNIQRSEKKKLLSPDEIYTCPNYDLALRRPTFFRPSNNSLGASFLRQCPGSDNIRLGPIVTVAFTWDNKCPADGVRINRKTTPTCS